MGELLFPCPECARGMSKNHKCHPDEIGRAKRLRDEWLGTPTMFSVEPAEGADESEGDKTDAG